MKINRKSLSLIIASMCGTSASTMVAQEITQATSIASSGRIGDVGPESATYSDPRMGSIRSNDSSVPFAAETMQPVAFHTPNYVAPGVLPENSVISSSCSEPCATACVSPRRKSSSGWLESESLLWWGKGLTGAPVILGGTGPASSSPRFPLIGGQDNPLGTDMMVGMRLTAGKWLDCDRNYALMGRVFGILTDGTSESFTNNGNYTGVAFFDTTFGPSTYNVNNTPVGNIGSNTGVITVDNDLDLIAAEASLRTLLVSDSKSRVDLLTGYTFLRMDSAYQLTTQFTDGITNGIQNGTVISSRDTFGTKNTFHGGHIGLLSEVSSGRFAFNLLGKVALGNVNQRADVSGAYSEVPPVGAAFTDNRGIFAQSSNIGTATRDRFTFIPEAGAKMKYQLGQGQFGVGYTLLVLPNFAVAADQIDQNIDFVNIGGAMTAPGPRFSTDTYFLHGLDLGYTLQF